MIQDIKLDCCVHLSPLHPKEEPLSIPTGIDIILHH